MGLRRKKDGITIIEEQVGKFQNIIDGLDKGICCCEDEQKSNAETIEKLTEKNGAIEKSKKQAVAFKGNLSSMLEIPDEKKEEKPYKPIK